MRLVGISGSLRKGSFNTALLRAAIELAPGGVELVQASIAGIPLYNADEEVAEGVPAAVTALKDAIMGADGVLMVTPEYNSGLPGVFKNAVDWTTRPPADIGRVWKGRKVAVIGASQGGFGTIEAQGAWLGVLHKLGATQWHGARITVARAQTLFDADGGLTDQATRDQLKAFIEGFAAFVRG